MIIKALALGTLIMIAAPIVAAPRQGYAARHNSLERVARTRGMPAVGYLFASPLYPIGARVCVAARRVRQALCGTIVDVPQPQHKAWQLRTGRIIEVQPRVALLLCGTARGRPDECPIRLWRP